MLVETEFQYRLAEVNLHFSQMSNPAETTLVIVIVLLAGAYLTRRYVLKKRSEARGDSCGGTCGCSATKPKFK